MIAPQSDNLRWSERMKKTPVYWHVESLAKKIRKEKPELRNSNTLINANAEQKEIDMFYKVGWDHEHAPFNITSDISQPLFLQPDSDFPLLHDYYAKITSFITRFKTEHEDDSVCRIALTPYLTLQELALDQPHNLVCAKGIYKTALTAMHELTYQMHVKMKQLEERGVTQQMAGKYWQVKYSFQAMQNWLEKYGREIGQFPDPENETPGTAPIAEETLQFMANFVETVSTMRAEGRPALFNCQPNMEMLTHLVHPLLLGIYAEQQREQVEWEHQYQHDIHTISFEERVQKDATLPPDPPQFDISKVLFLNLDGYESQYNLEFARNMDQHLMYVSFPRFDNQAHEEDLSVNNRFFKKMLFNYTRDLYELDRNNFNYLQEDMQNMGMDDEYDSGNVEEEFYLKYNPEEYYACVDRMLGGKKKGSNIYILPVIFQYLFKEMVIKGEGDARNNSSYFVWALLRDFLGDDIKKFNPTYVVVSYSGRINLLDAHFTLLLQELCLASNRRVLFFPNFTAELAEDIALDQVYDNFPPSQPHLVNAPLDLLHKMAQFLKITSGTYNLDLSITNLPVLSRYKLGKVSRYILDLLDGLSHHEYPHLKGRVPDIIMKSTDVILSRGLAQCEKELENGLPRYYKELFNKIQTLLLSKGQEKCFGAEVEQVINQIRSNLGEGEGRGSIEQIVNEILQKFILEISSQHITEEALLYFKTRDDKEDFRDIKDHVPTTASLHFTTPGTSPPYINNLNGFYSISFRRPDKQKIILTSSSEIVYKLDQRKAFEADRRRAANVMLMNHLSSDGSELESYAGLLKLSEEIGGSKSKAVEERLEMGPVVITGGPALEHKYVVRAQWNYAETHRFYILYWPVEYNILEAKLKSIEEIGYSGRVLPELYVAAPPAKGALKKQPLVFRLVQTDMQNVIPRQFCSAYEMYEEDKVFIMGGFYQKEYNYLYMQSDITGMDFQFYDPEHGGKCVVTNEKGTMYSSINENNMENADATTNSYLRTRRDLEFLELSSLANLEPQQLVRQQQQERTVLILGGYGQDFTRPYSLMYCNYFEMRVDVPSRSIRSIQKRTAYHQVLTANVKGMIKNQGVFQKFTLLDNKVLKPNAPIDSECYIAHRSVFYLRNRKAPPSKPPSEDSEARNFEESEEELSNVSNYTVENTFLQVRAPYELTTKMKYCFGTKLFGQLKKEYHSLAYRIGESTGLKAEAEEFILSVSGQGNHYLIIQKEHRQSQMRQLLLDAPNNGNASDKHKGNLVALPHGSIISIDIKNKAVYALLHHEVYTQGGYVLAQCTLTTDENDIVLKVLHRFKTNMSQFSLFVPKLNQVLLLHGTTFPNATISDLFLSHKKDGGEVTKELPLKPVNFLPATAHPSTVHTYFIKDENPQSRNLEVQSLTFVVSRRPKDNLEIPCIANRLKLSFDNPVENFYWENDWQCHFVFEDVLTRERIPVARIEDMKEASREGKQGRLRWRPDNVYLLRVISHGKKSYIVHINGNMGLMKEAMEDEKEVGDKKEMEDESKEMADKKEMGDENEMMTDGNKEREKIGSMENNERIETKKRKTKGDARKGDDKVWRVPAYSEDEGDWSREMIDIWEKSLCVQAHVKSLARYRDNNVTIPDIMEG